jgi:flagellar basal-body rod modification protein FlgD
MSNINTDYSRRTLEEYQNATSARNTGELGKSDFLNLLVAQLANQNPLEPAKDTEFIAQLATFSTLEQMQTLTQSYANTQASSMVGKYIEGYYTASYVGTDAEGNPEVREQKTAIAGLVDGYVIKSGVAYLQIQGLDSMYSVKMSDVERVVDAESIDGYDFNNSVLQSSNLIGKYVEGTSKVYGQNEDGTTNMDDVREVTAKGFVERIEIDQGVIMAVITVDGKEERLDVRSINYIAPTERASETTDDTDA